MVTVIKNVVTPGFVLLADYVDCSQPIVVIVCINLSLSHHRIIIYHVSSLGTHAIVRAYYTT